jgi:peptidoglycan hydrolase-like protein with peptidoglycan-binding domain
MGLQEHAGEKLATPDAQEMAPDEEIATESEAPATEEKSEAPTDAGAAKEEEPQSEIERMVAEAIAKYGPTPPPSEMVALALVFGCTPSSAEYVELMQAVQEQCGNGYAMRLESEFIMAGEEATKEKKEETGAEPADEAAAVEEEPAEEEAKKESPEDPAALEQEGPVAEEVPPALVEEPVVKEQVAKQTEEKEAEAPSPTEVQEQNTAAETEAPPEQVLDERQPAKAPNIDLRRGDKGPEVEELQRILISLGFMTQEEMDTGPGIFGPRTERALRAYQESQGLPATGFYGPMTRESLAQVGEPAAKVDEAGKEAAANADAPPEVAAVVPELVEQAQDPTVSPEDKAVVAETLTQLNEAQPEEQGKEEPSTLPEEEPANSEAAPEAKAEAAAEEIVPEDVAPVESPAEEVSEPEPETKSEVVEVAAEKVDEVAPDETEHEEVVETAQKSDEQQQEQQPSQDDQEETEGLDLTLLGVASFAAVALISEEGAKDQEAEPQQSDETAPPAAEPEVKEEAAQDQQEEMVAQPEEAQLDDAEKPRESEEEQDAKKDEMIDAADQQVEEQPAVDAGVEAAAVDVTALLAAAQQLLEMQTLVLANLHLQTTEATIQSDAEALIGRFGESASDYASDLDAMSDKLIQSGDDSARQMAGELSKTSDGLGNEFPPQIDVTVALDSGEELAFAAPVSSRETAVQEILQAFALQLELREGEKAHEEEPKLEADETPPPTA